MRGLGVAAAQALDQETRGQDADGNKHDGQEEARCTGALAHHIAPLCGAVETNGMPKKVEKASTKIPITISAPSTGGGRRRARRCR